MCLQNFKCHFTCKKLFITDRGQICSDKQLEKRKTFQNLQNKLRQSSAYENIGQRYAAATFKEILGKCLCVGLFLILSLLLMSFLSLSLTLTQSLSLSLPLYPSLTYSFYISLSSANESQKTQKPNNVLIVWWVEIVWDLFIYLFGPLNNFTNRTINCILNVGVSTYWSKLKSNVSCSLNAMTWEAYCLKKVRYLWGTRKFYQIYLFLSLGVSCGA